MFGSIFCYAAFRDNNWIDHSDSTHTKFRFIFMATAFVISFLGSIPAKLTALRYATLVSSIIVFYVVIVIVVDYFTIKTYFDHKYSPVWNLAIFDGSIFSSYCLSLFSVVNQFSIINIIAELKNPTDKRIMKVVGRSSIFP